MNPTRQKGSSETVQVPEILGYISRFSALPNAELPSKRGAPVMNNRRFQFNSSCTKNPPDLFWVCSYVMVALLSVPWFTVDERGEEKPRATFSNRSKYRS